MPAKVRIFAGTLAEGWEEDFEALSNAAYEILGIKPPSATERILQKVGLRTAVKAKQPI